MKTMTVATHKGGAGKTVTSMALAAGFARTGAQVLLVDLDPQGHSTLGLGVEVEGCTIADVLQSSDRPLLEGALRDTKSANLQVAASDIRLERVQYWLYTRPRREQFLVNLLAPFAATYDFCVVDCPPSLGVLTEGAVAAADVVLVPCQMEARASDALVDLLELVQVIKGEAFAAWRIVRTRVDARKTVTNAAIAAALEPWASHVVPEAIPQSEPLNQAQMFRKDIFSFSPQCAGAVAYTSLVETMRAVLEARA